MRGDMYKRVNAEYECFAASLQPDGKCFLGASKAPALFKSVGHELCHTNIRLDYLIEFVKCEEDPDPGLCCSDAYECYCDAAEACDRC